MVGGQRELLRGALYDLAEHQATGAPIAPPIREEVQKLEALLSELDIALRVSGMVA